MPGRFQRVGRYIFDVAHNPDGARRARADARAPSRRREPIARLLCVLRDKDWRDDDRALWRRRVDAFVLTDGADRSGEPRAGISTRRATFAREHGIVAPTS